jgi:hypothetical protein
VPLGYLKELAGYWADSCDWRAWEAKLNEHPQFVTTVDGQRIHFIHARSAEPDALALLALHGWPGSIVELEQVMGPLADPGPTAARRPTPSPWSPPRFPGSGSPARRPSPAGTSPGSPGPSPSSWTGWATGATGSMAGTGGRSSPGELGRTGPGRVAGVRLTMLPSAVPVAEPAPEELAALSEQERERVRASWSAGPA